MEEDKCVLRVEISGWSVQEEGDMLTMTEKNRVRESEKISRVRKKTKLIGGS